MKRLQICLLLPLLLLTTAWARPPVANVKLIAHQYYDEYERKWHEVDFLCIQSVDNPIQCQEMRCGGVEMAEVTLEGLKPESRYRILVRWKNGAKREEIFTVYETGNLSHWIDLPD